MIEMTPEQIDQLLDRTPIGRLSMADLEGRPYTIPLPFCWIDDALYLRLPLVGRKGAILAQNNRVCFEVDHYTPTMDEYSSVLVEGILVSVENLQEKVRVKAANDEKYNRLRQGHRPGHGRSTPIEQLPLKKIVVQSISGREREPSALATASAGGR